MKSLLRLASLHAAFLLCLSGAAAPAQTLYVANSGVGVVGEYNGANGSTINAAFVSNSSPTGSSPTGLRLFGNTLYVVDNGASELLAYNATTGAAQPGFTTVTGLSNAQGVVVSGNTVFVANLASGTVGAYNATTGATINASFLTGLGNVYDMAAVGNTLYVDRSGTGVSTYDATTGAVLNANFITLTNPSTEINVTGNNLYLVDYYANAVALYNASSGALVNPSLVTGLLDPRGLAVADNALYVTSTGRDVVGKYDATTGATINARFISSGLRGPTFLDVVPEPSTWALLSLSTLGAGVVVLCRRHAHRTPTTPQVELVHRCHEPSLSTRAQERQVEKMLVCFSSSSMMVKCTHRGQQVEG